MPRIPPQVPRDLPDYAESNQPTRKDFNEYLNEWGQDFPGSRRIHRRPLATDLPRVCPSAMWADSEGRCHPFERPPHGLTTQADHSGPKAPWEPPVDIHKVHSGIHGALDWLDRYVPNTCEYIFFKRGPVK